MEDFDLLWQPPTQKRRRPKRWGIVETTDTCYECGHRTYRLVWPWTVTYDDVPVLFTESWVNWKNARMETDFGDFEIKTGEDDDDEAGGGTTDPQ